MNTADNRYYSNTTTLNNIQLASGDLNMNTHKITNLLDPVLPDDAVNKQYIDSNFYTQTAGDARYYQNTTTLDQITAASADVTLNTHKITNLVDPVGLQDAATKNYVD